MEAGSLGTAPSEVNARRFPVLTTNPNVVGA